MSSDGEDWVAFGVEISAGALSAMRQDAEARYPREACGLVFGTSDGSGADRCRPLTNVAQTSGGFAFDPGEHVKVLEEEEGWGRVERVHYHSHADAGAYLSADDRAALAPEGHPVMPGVVHVVIEVRGGEAKEMAAFRWNPETRRFDELHPSSRALPDLELRAGEAPLPIRPVGGRLAARRLGPEEASRLAGLAEGRQIRLDAASEAWVRRFELGLLSPLTGFQRPDEARAVVALGRTPQGVPWRMPVTLEVPAEVRCPSGQVVELVGSTGALGLMVVGQVGPGTQRGGTIIGGPIYLYPTDEADARDVRAIWIAAGAERVLAVPRALAKDVDLERFDGILTDAPGDWGLPQAPLREVEGEPWLTAAMAQNAGATHILVDDGSVAKDIADALQIEGIRWPPEPG